MKNNDDQILVSSIYLFYDIEHHTLFPTQNKDHLGGIPFTIFLGEYATNNLYEIIENRGVGLSNHQIEAIEQFRHKVVGKDGLGRTNNKNTATLTKKELCNLIYEIDSHISKFQLKEMGRKQNIYTGILIDIMEDIYEK